MRLFSMWQKSLLLNVCALAVCCGDPATEKEVPVPLCSEHLPMGTMLEGRKRIKKDVPFTREDCDRYMASGGLSEDPCAVKIYRYGLELAPNAAWREKDGWKALKVRLDGSMEVIFFNDKDRSGSLAAVTVNHDSMMVSRKMCGGWKTGKDPVLHRMTYYFDPEGKWMKEAVDIVWPDGTGFNDWFLSHSPVKPFTCKNDVWVDVGALYYTLHRWKVEEGRLLWWRRESVPVAGGKEGEGRRTMYFPDRGFHPSHEVEESWDPQEVQCFYYDASGHVAARLMYRDGVLDRKESWFLQPRMDAAAMAAKKEEARHAEERRMLEYLYRFAPYAERAAAGEALP